MDELIESMPTNFDQMERALWTELRKLNMDFSEIAETLDNRIAISLSRCTVSIFIHESYYSVYIDACSPEEEESYMLDYVQFEMTNPADIATMVRIAEIGFMKFGRE